MQKTIGPILLIAGTAIGSGMIALPMVLAPLGLSLTLLLMVLMWLLVYYTALINLELNLQAKRGLPLDQLARLFSGPIAQKISLITLFSLCYALLAVYIDGSTAIVQSWWASWQALEQSKTLTPSPGLALGITLILALILSLPMSRVDQTNRLLFLGLMGVTVLLLLGLGYAINWQHMPWTDAESNQKLLNITTVLPILLTSFGFQVIFHTLTNYCHQDAETLKKAFFWGSLIPAGLYLIWTFSALSVLYERDLSFYATLKVNRPSVGELVNHLGQITAWPGLQCIVWSVSILAILTSMVGVGLGLCQTLKSRLGNHLGWAIVCTSLPPYFIALFTPYAFIAILRVAGLLLTVIALFMPIYLLYRLSPQRFYYPICAKHRYRVLAILAGCLIAWTEITHLYCFFKFEENHLCSL